MSQVAQLRARRQELLAELAQLEQIRRGSVVEQFVEAVHKDGGKVRRGPYTLYSFKEKGKTVSRRVRTKRDAETYRKQIASFRRFQQVVSELLRLGEQLSDLSLCEDEEVKKKVLRRS